MTLGFLFNDLTPHFSLADSNLSSAMMWLECKFSDCFCIFGFSDEFANVVVNLSSVYSGQVLFSFFRLGQFFELLVSVFCRICCYWLIDYASICNRQDAVYKFC